MCDRAAVRLVTPAALAARHSCARAFPGRPDQLRHVRALLAGFLDAFPAADEAILLISELAANACAHSASGQPGGTFTVRASLSGTCLCAEVEDQGSGWDGRLSPAEAPHGLYLLRTLSAACGTVPGGQGWITWFTLVPGPPAPAPRTARRNGTH
jgi:Histidine kinase-like ATPase domain